MKTLTVRRLALGFTLATCCVHATAFTAHSRECIQIQTSNDTLYELVSSALAAKSQWTPVRSAENKTCTPTLFMTTLVTPMKREDRRLFFRGEKTVGQIVAVTLRSADGKRHMIFAAGDDELRFAASKAIQQLLARI